MKNYKTGFVVFLFLATIISLFPPFEFGNEKLRTLSERKHNKELIDKLPVKKYDFILGSNKKYFILDYYAFQKKFYGKDSLEYCRDIWNDKQFSFNLSSIDTFYTAYRVLYKWDNNSYPGYGINDPDHVSFWFTSRDPLYTILIRENSIFRYKKLETNKDAINYNTVKDDYEKSPIGWRFYYEFHLDSIKKFDEYNITQPVYYLLERRILFSELLVEYFLAFFISIITGYLIDKFRLKRTGKAEF